MHEGFIGTELGRVHYVRAGSGHPLILLHSNGNSVHEWEDVIDDLASSFDVIALDQPGQGDSDGLPRHMTIDEYSDSFIEVMDALDVERAAVAGTSIGGLFVVSLGARYPDRFSHIVAIETMFRSDAEWASHWQTVDGLFAVPTQNRTAVEARFNEVSDEFLTRWNIDRNKAGSKSMMSTMWAIREYELGHWAKQVTGPTLLMYGAKGPTIATRAQFEASLPECDVIVLENSGHFPMNDEPTPFAEAIKNFCGS
ncbi:MAG: pimeloyl-ACP methyl ester carboxylesterase [Verrucomicrobiales bacterium]|jgi:pimeloyl-ACP methyl ester carboxylesterase